MKFLYILLVLAIYMALLVNLSLANNKNNQGNEDEINANNKEDSKLQNIDSYQGSSPFLNLKKHESFNPSKPWNFFHSKQYPVYDPVKSRGYFPNKKHSSRGPFNSWSSFNNKKHHKQQFSRTDPYNFWNHYHPKEQLPYGQGGQPRNQLTCDRFPRVCHVKGSPGQDCCKKKCVNVKTDNLNCGMCGLKCKFPETCCNGRCVNSLNDRKHCGGCHNKCNRGSICYNGMCNYA